MDTISPEYGKSGKETAKMDDIFHITKHEIDEAGVLNLCAEGRAMRGGANHKLRIAAVFQAGRFVRRFPIEAISKVSGQAADFKIEQGISLRDIFYQLPREWEGKSVIVEFEYCDVSGVWTGFQERMELPGAFFLYQDRRNLVVGKFAKRVAYVVCTLLLPLWLIDGWFVVKGWKKSEYVDEEIKGKKAIFYHAQGIVKHLTGYGYSMREIKTGYFARKYQRACRKIAVPEGIFFLSEREADQGGNLDLIRRGIQSSGQKWDEFIDTRSVHKLPFSELRRAARLAAGAKVIVLEDFYPQIHALSLRKETKLLQLWHACGAFKMFGLSDIGKVNNLGQDTKNHRNYSFAFVSGTHMVPFYSEAFGIAPSQVLPLGVPRTDIFFDKGYKDKMRAELFKRYPILQGKRVVLFAPTFRGSGKKRAYYPEEHFSVDKFLERMPEDVVLIIKNHPFVKNSFSFHEQYSGRVIDLSGRENINDVLFVTDLLITDYSSSIFEAALLKIPMLFYVFDLEEYVNGRDIYFDFASFIPGKQADTFEELIEAVPELIERDFVGSDEKLQEFCGYFLDSLDGHSTERIVEFIKNILAE